VETAPRKTSLKRLILGLFVLLFGGIGCTQSGVLFQEFTDVASAGWERDSSVQFDVAIEDTVQPYVVLVTIRHTDEYPFRNCFLGRQVIGAHGVEYQDTVEIQLANAEGKWLGQGVGGVKTLTVPFRAQAVSFQKSGLYRFRFSHVMRETPLPGIRSIGLSIEPAEAQR
jgi:gliding motility-associated lipoprotein GldH